MSWLDYLLLALIGGDCADLLLRRKKKNGCCGGCSPGGGHKKPGNRRNRIGCKRYDRRKRESRQDREIIIAFIHIEYHEKRNQI